MLSKDVNIKNGMVRTKTKDIAWTPYLATAYAEGFAEGEDATEEERIEAFQYLIDTGLVWKLQGWYGRTAMDLINRGLCQG
jgi:hypothetical protein